MSWKAAWELIKAIPQIWALIKAIITLLKKQERQAQDNKLEKATEKVQQAQGAKETENAFEDLFNRPR